MKHKMGGWSFKEQRQLIELTSASLSLETIGDRLNRSAASVFKKSVQLGLSINGPEGKRNVRKRNRQDHLEG
jgi:Na+/phosphate symporter